MSYPFRKLLSLVTVATVIGCGGPNLFDAPSAAIDVEFREETPVVIDYVITGGFAGTYRHLTVFSNQLVRFSDDPRAPQRSYRDRLDNGRYENLISTFITANFFGLGDRYLDPRVADAFHYTITFSQEGETKTVEAQDGAVPQQLQDILSALNNTIDTLVREGIRLKLSLSDSSIAAGDSVTFTLTVTAPSGSGRTLVFPSGQIYDFFVVADPLPPGDLIPEDKMVWKWSADRVFTQMVWKMELKAGESRSYSETWVARDVRENLLRGPFWVIGSLVSVPGGDSRAVELRIE